MVTGGTGFVGMRLVEMLVQRGAERVVSFDIVPPPAEAWRHPAIEWKIGDITDAAAVAEACSGGIDVVFHIAAAVGPYHPQTLYRKVNYQGTLNVLAGCKAHGVPKLVMSSSPSTRFDGSDVDGFTEAQMPTLPMKSYLAPYAETKALGEMAVSEACCPELLTINVAPHQVYGPRDNLFMPNILESCGTGKIRVFGSGDSRICFTHVDNYAHGLIIAADALKQRAACLGKFYIVTDGNTHPDPRGCAVFWDLMDEATPQFGFSRITSRFGLPYYFIMFIALCCDIFQWVTGIKLKLNTFSVRMLTMHRWFDISAAEKDLKYRPVIAFNDGWQDTLGWFKENWLPGFHKKKNGLAGISNTTERKIGIQSDSVFKKD
jgi:nucleoside-diphosphate-sugar epimerase